MIRGHQRTPRRRVCSRSDPHTATRSQRVTAHTPDEAGRFRIFVQIVLVIIVLAIAPVMRAEFLTALQLSLSTRDGEPFFTLTRHLGVIQPAETSGTGRARLFRCSFQPRQQGGAEMGAYATGFSGGAPSTTRTRSGSRSCGGSRCPHLRVWRSPDRHSRRFAGCPGWDRRGSAGDPQERPGMAAGSRERTPSSPSQVGDHVVLMCDEGYQSSLVAATIPQLGYSRPIRSDSAPVASCPAPQTAGYRTARMPIWLTVRQQDRNRLRAARLTGTKQSGCAAVVAGGRRNLPGARRLTGRSLVRLGARGVRRYLGGAEP